MTGPRVAIVTGANRGIGFAIIRQLALQYRTSALSANGSPLLIYLAARSAQSGEAAARTLLQDPELNSAGVLAAHEGGKGKVSIEYHQLDIAHPQSTRDFRDFLRKRHPEGIDAVINNAGMAGSGFNAEVVRTTLQCNYYGTLEATRSFLPLLRSGGRIVNVASSAGSLSRYSPSIQTRFRAATTVDEVTAIMEEFHKAVAENRYDKAGFPGNAYAVSKAGMIAFTGVIGKDMQKEGKGVLVNSCCPGWVVTDMTKGRGTKTPDDGAQTPVMLAIKDIGGEVGKYWRNEKLETW